MLSHLLIIPFTIKFHFKRCPYFTIKKKFGVLRNNVVVTITKFWSTFNFYGRNTMKCIWFKFTWDEICINNIMKKYFICCVPEWMLCHSPNYWYFDLLDRIPKNITLCEKGPDNTSMLSFSRQYKMRTHLIFLRHLQGEIN